MIKLDARLNSDLKWKISIEKGKPLFWYLDFGFQEALPPFHQNTFLAIYLSVVDVFIEQCWKPYRTETQGVYLYLGTLDQACKIQWSADFEEDYLEWKKKMPKLEKLRAYYEIRIFSEYLHRLAAGLPEELRTLVAFDVPETSSPSRLAQMLSLEYFSYVEVEVQGTPYPIRCYDKALALGVAFPLLSQASEAVFDEIDAVLKMLNDRKIPFRLIPESHLTEEWAGLDDLILFSKTVSSQGLRKAQGFAAAGGRLVLVGHSLGLTKEITINDFLKEIRGRGI